MVSKDELLEFAERENIPVMTVSCKKCGSISLLMGENCYIGIDKDTPESELTERCAHELGHCEKGAFYNRFSPFDIVSRHEARADKWAIEKLCPEDELVEQLEQNVDSIYRLAQHFGVSEDFMIKACKFYGYYNEAI